MVGTFSVRVGGVWRLPYSRVSGVSYLLCAVGGSLFARGSLFRQMETNASQLGLASRPTHAAFVRAGLNWHAGFAPCGVMIQMYDARVFPRGAPPTSPRTEQKRTRIPSSTRPPRRRADAKIYYYVTS